MTADNSACFSSDSKPFTLCLVCNNLFTPKRSSSTCCSTPCRDKYKYQLKRVETVKQCIQCSNSFVRKQGQSKFCSSLCRNEHIASQGKIARESFTSIAEAHIRVSFCVVCSGFCEAPYQGPIRKFCSKSCENKLERTTPRYRAKRARRDALKRNALSAESVDPIAILNRDSWRCYLCGVHTPKELRGTYESNAPEVDHVVPLSKGGLHAESNLRCACRSCNRLKSDKVY